MILVKTILRRIRTINITKIKYILVADTKIYEVISINWLHFEIEAKETDLSIDAVPEDELWDISCFKDFNVKLINQKGGAEVVDFAEFMRKHRG